MTDYRLQMTGRELPSVIRNLSSALLGAICHLSSVIRHLLSPFSVPTVIGVSGEDRASAVELLGEDQAGQGVGEGEGAERQQDFGARECSGRPAAGGTDGEDDVLHAVLTVCPQPSSEEFGGHGAAAAIQQDGHGRRSRVLAFEPGEEGVLGLERLLFAAQEDRAPLQILRGEGLKRVVGGKTGADVRECNVHLRGGYSRAKTIKAIQV